MPLSEKALTMDRKKYKRALEAKGFVHLRGGWVRLEVARRLQARIDAAVKLASREVEKIKEDNE